MLEPVSLIKFRCDFLTIVILLEQCLIYLFRVKRESCFMVQASVPLGYRCLNCSAATKHSFAVQRLQWMRNVQCGPAPSWKLLFIYIVYIKQCEHAIVLTHKKPILKKSERHASQNYGHSSVGIIISYFYPMHIYIQGVKQLILFEHVTSLLLLSSHGTVVIVSKYIEQLLYCT